MDINIINRKLRPIFDNLELGNNKKAIQEADKVLKKTPIVQCARALKALALLRIGRSGEGETIMKQLFEERPSDVSTLQVMTFFYRETEELDKICTLYANAVAATPGNEDLMTHLFMAYVRINDYKQQQTAALQLYKARPKNPYYFWAVMSVVLQALRGVDAKEPQKVRVLLALAQRMIDKLIKEDKLDAEQEVELYMTVLRYQEKFEEVLDVFNGPLCRKHFPGAPVTIKIDMLRQLRRWPELNKLFKQLLTEEQDRWDYYKEYIGSCFELWTTGDATEGADFNVELCNTFLEGIIETNPKVRGPRLARLELHRRMREKEMDADALLGDYAELMIAYYNKFGDRICCTNDLRLFLQHLDAAKRPDFAAKLLQECGISSTTLPESKEQMQKHICALQISRICGAHMSLGTDHLVALCTALSLHYEHGMSAFGTNLLPTDIGPSDPYALLAVHVMYDLSLRSQSSDRLLEALCLLNYLLTNSPSNFHAKLLCLHIYHIFGCAYGAHDQYQSLDVKHIQLDSMGFVHCAHLAAGGIPSLARQLYDATLKFFTTSCKDTLEYLAMAYKFGSFSKLQEFMDFRERLANSLHYAATSIEALLLDLALLGGTPAQNWAAYRGMNVHADEEPVKWDELRDNRDLSALCRWDPFYQPTEEAPTCWARPPANLFEQMRKESFVQDVELLQVRTALLRLVAAQLDLMAPRGEDDEARERLQYRLRIVTLLRTHWRELFGRVRQMKYTPTSNECLVNLLPSRLHLVLRLPYETLFGALADLVVALWQGEKAAVAAAEQFNAEAKEVQRIFAEAIRTHNESKDPIWGRREVQETIVGCIEILSLASYVLSVSHDRYAPGASGAASRKGKRHNQLQNGISETEVTEKERLTLIVTTSRALKTTLTEMEATLDTWKSPFMKSSLTECLAALSLNPSVETLVSKTFESHHQMSVKELKSLLKDKIKMVNK